MSSKNRTVLVVDDEPETLRGYAEFLGSPTDSPSAGRRSSRAPVKSGDSQPAAAAETYRILQAESGERALEIVREELAAGKRIAAGFFDVKLGSGMDGIATIQAIRALDPEIHCVIVTAYHDRSVDEINQLFGEDFKDRWDYLNKPFTPGEIIQKARQMTSAWNRLRRIEELHDQLVRSERLAAVGQIAKGVGHEFGNILLRIMGKADLALMSEDVAKIHEHLKVVLSASERAGVIVRNLQSFSKNAPQYQFARLSAPMNDALTLIHHDFVKSSVTVERDFQEGDPLRIDAGAIGQVFLNLLINAVHAMPEGGQLKIAIREELRDGKSGSRVSVTDTGSGIPADVLPRIFDYAFTTKGARGSGLGLSISREIVLSHGGEIQARSEPGRGAEFTVWIPRKQEGQS